MSADAHELPVGSAGSLGAPVVDDAGAGPTSLVGRAAVLIWNDVADEGRDSFYRWHDNEHIPERLAIPGFRRGRRFIRPNHSPEWLTMYEADDLPVFVSPAYFERLNAPTPATVSTLRHFRNTSRAVCRVVHSVGSSTGGHVLAMRLSVSDASQERMCRYLSDAAFPQAMTRTGVVACHVYAADSSASHAPTAESSTRTIDVPAWVVLCESSTAAAAENAKTVIDSPDLRQLGVSVRDAAVYALEICRLSLPANKERARARRQRAQRVSRQPHQPNDAHGKD